VKKPSKHPFKMLRYRKNDLAHNVICAVQHWIHANGGNATVLGGIGLMDGETTYKYYVTIGALGKKPEKKNGEKSNP
jgi:hypothetical protein